MFEPGDLMDLFKFFQVVAENVTGEIRDSAALIITWSFRSISGQIDNGPIDDIDSEYYSGELLIDNTDDEVNLLTITLQQHNLKTKKLTCVTMMYRRYLSEYQELEKVMVCPITTT